MTVSLRLPNTASMRSITFAAVAELFDDHVRADSPQPARR
jgi:hypothetical protein